MLRSLYSGISGLRTHQMSLDVTGNNISNVNTTGFKSGRVTFEESMSQLVKGASRPPGNAGGTNPIQVGLGSSVGSIDTLTTQGNLQSTGKITDLAVEGKAYFAYSNGDEKMYSRNGALQMDSEGKLVSPTNGGVLQGMMADSEGTYPAGTQIGDINIPFGQKSPANDTSYVKYSSNLDADSEGLGTVSHTNQFFATAGTDTPLRNLYDENGNDLGIRAGDTLEISLVDANDPALETQTENITVTDTMTLSELATAVESHIASNVTNAGPVDVSIDADGNMEVDMSMVGSGTPGGADISSLSISSDRPGSNSYVTNMFSWERPMNGGDTYDSAGSARRPALSSDLLSEVYDASGQTLGLEEGAAAGEPSDEIRINGSIGGDPADQNEVTYSSTMTMEDLITEIQNTYNLPDRDGTYQNNFSVELNPAGNEGNARLPEGAIIVRGQPEEDFALTNLNVMATNADLDDTAPTRFTSNMLFTTVQNARDTEEHSTSIEVYDESGEAHTMTTTFTHSGTPNEWLWEINMEGDEQIVSGSAGRLYFGQDGSPSAITFDDGTTSFRFNPNNGSNEVDIDLDIGSPGAFDGITQFRSETTTAAKEQDGYPMGKLSEISVDEFGEISGVFTNGVSQPIAKLMLAEFNNPAGLMKEGDSMYKVSNNSGEAVMQEAGIGTPSKIKPGSLEMSNVDLANEFTTLITTQRGYQANARVITTSDSLLQELVQLVR